MQTPTTKGPVTMRHFTLGLVLGSLLISGLVSAGTFYNSKGQPAAPAGSVQSYDYFRQRQFFLDQGAIRKQGQEEHLTQLTHPCGK